MRGPRMLFDLRPLPGALRWPMPPLRLRRLQESRPSNRCAVTASKSHSKNGRRSRPTARAGLSGCHRVAMGADGRRRRAGWEPRRAAGRRPHRQTSMAAGQLHRDRKTYTETGYRGIQRSPRGGVPAGSIQSDRERDSAPGDFRGVDRRPDSQWPIASVDRAVDQYSCAATRLFAPRDSGHGVSDHPRPRCCHSKSPCCPRPMGTDAWYF